MNKWIANSLIGIAQYILFKKQPKTLKYEKFPLIKNDEKIARNEVYRKQTNI